MLVADFFLIKVWKGATDAKQQLLLNVQVCRGGVGFAWGVSRIRVQEEAETSPWFLGRLKSIDRNLSQEVLRKQGLLSQVVPASTLSYVGASIRAQRRLRNEGFVFSSNSSFSMRVDSLDSAVCLGAADIDVRWKLRSSHWLPELGGEPPKTVTVDISWSPLISAPAKDTIGIDKTSAEFACSPDAVASRGSVVPEDSVVYELFIAKANKAQGNWLASCGMYQDAFLLQTAEKIIVPQGRLWHSITVDFDDESAYKIGLVAKYFREGSAGLAQPFAYRYTEVSPDARLELFRFGGVSVFLLLLLVAVLVAVAWKFINRGGRVTQAFRQTLASVRRRKAFNRQEGLELRAGAAKKSAYGPVPTTIGCVDDALMHEGDPADSPLESAELSEMPGTPWLPHLEISGFSAENGAFMVCKEFLDNAVDACSKATANSPRFPLFREGEVELEIALDGPYLSVTCRDNGIGIDCDSVAALGEVFSSSKANDEKTGGEFGIGLKAISSLWDEQKEAELEAYCAAYTIWRDRIAYRFRVQTAEDPSWSRITLGETSLRETIVSAFHSLFNNLQKKFPWGFQSLKDIARIKATEVFAPSMAASLAGIICASPNPEFQKKALNLLNLGRLSVSVSAPCFL
ncbi:uncharacterized protein EMH_0092570 [Eimeria mitis]|uniref:Histidine kinase/HSP90-like ATPase domain-containing protein n=1 Tax=Eimeria mitis TaxID=44415 RepID=U6KHR6_9EIME|nr:uncharacterized protein EMH_0092570 [Eimeria mitis]CDJ35812.1 hypothetical protein EMH_0092570 [Eimeria mitis]